MLHKIFSQPFLIISIIFCISLEEIDPLRGLTAHFLVGMGLTLLAGFLIGLERESKGKPAGISTHCFVIGGSMIFS
jgi:MgtC family protein